MKNNEKKNKVSNKKNIKKNLLSFKAYLEKNFQIIILIEIFFLILSILNLTTDYLITKKFEENYKEMFQMVINDNYLNEKE